MLHPCFIRYQHSAPPGLLIVRDGRNVATDVTPCCYYQRYAPLGLEIAAKSAPEGRNVGSDPGLAF